jgi:hypothetical protein
MFLRLLINKNQMSLTYLMIISAEISVSKLKSLSAKYLHNFIKDKRLQFISEWIYFYLFISSLFYESFQ